MKNNKLNHLKKNFLYFFNILTILHRDLLKQFERNNSEIERQRERLRYQWKSQNKSRNKPSWYHLTMNYRLFKH